MIALRKVLESVENGLEVLLQKTKDMQILLDNLEEALTVEQPKRRTEPKARPKRKRRAIKPAVKKKPAKQTATDAVLNVIKSSRKGVTTAQIKKKTGFSEKKIWEIVNRAKRDGKVKSVKRGVYVKK